MDWETACKTLKLSQKHTERGLKKAYYKQALKYHPDKNKSKDAESKFKKINEAYCFLLQRQGCYKGTPEIDTNYRDIIKSFLQYFTPDIKWNDLFLDTTLDNIINNCGKISIRLFKDLKKEKSIELFGFLSNHREIFGISDEIISQMKDILKEKMRGDNIIILNPSLTDLLSDNVYRLDFDDKKYYVPLWHNEVIFDHSGNDLIIKCIPDLEEHITIDNFNNLHCLYEGPITRVLNDKRLKITLGEKDFIIEGDKLVIKENQTIILRNQGILKINSEHLFSTTERADIYIDIKLESS
tara:strand:+ start:55 stop:945 length:891 start_codon:yes stop_codon:yes gene_type:complete